MFNSISAAIRRKNQSLERHRKIADSTIKPLVKPDSNEKGREEDRKRRLRKSNGADREK